MEHQHPKIVFLFSGQGSQYRGMGRNLFEQHEVFKESLLKSDFMVRQHLNRSLTYELYENNDPVFDDVLITHPAIAALEIAMYELLKSHDIHADYVLGNSLGEFAAAVVKGAWSHEMAIEASIKQAKSFVKNAPSGGMIAVITKDTKITAMYAKHKLYLASDNFPGHLTLSGTNADLDLFQEELKKREILHARLPVTFPFHSPLIDAARDEFAYSMSTRLGLSAAKEGFLSGMSGKEMSVLPAHYFWDAVSHYTDFSKLIRNLESAGPYIYIDLGASGTSATFVKYNLNKDSKSEVYPIVTAYNREFPLLEKLKKRMQRV